MSKWYGLINNGTVENISNSEHYLSQKLAEKPDNEREKCKITQLMQNHPIKIGDRI